MAETRYGHIVISTYNAWGHIKAACPLICKIVRRKKIHVTFIVSLPFYEKLKTEVDNRFEPGLEDDLRATIRIVVIDAKKYNFDFGANVYQRNIVEACKTLINESSLQTKPGSDDHVVDVGPPTLYIIDHMLKNSRYDTSEEIRKLSNGKTPIYAFATGGSVTTFSFSAPESLGGRNDLISKYQAIEHLDEKAREEEESKMKGSIKEEIVHLPGLPPMYDYEFEPQKLSFEFDVMKYMGHSHNFFSKSDGVILNSNEDFDKPAVEAWKSWLVQKPVISPWPTDFPLTEFEKKPTTNKPEITDFLNTALEKYGDNSVFYISFGSVFWPTEPEKLWAVLDILLEGNIPFLFAHASPFAVIPPEIMEKIKDNELALASSWMPQNEILRHKACGWFISHCGQNSMTEALCAGVPVIGWPYLGDQPANAAYISSVHKLGYELFEVRSGYGTLPIARLDNYTPVATVAAVKAEFNEVLKKALGDDGKEKRKNARGFQQKMEDTWKPDGRSWKEIDKIIDAALCQNQ